MNEIIINNKVFKKYDKMYYVSADGDVYSNYSNKILKQYIDQDGYHRVDIHGKHKKIHKLVYLVWIGAIEEGKQINHKDDDKNNNHYTNLYAGTQKENIRDCIVNEHRVGHVYYLVLYDKMIDKVVSFCPASDFISYSGHTSANGCISRFFDKLWFKERYDIIDYNIGKGVTTMADECRSVE